MGGALRKLLSLTTWALAIAGVLKLFFVDVIHVPHNGMAPTLVYGDLVLVWRNAKVDMADVVVCEGFKRSRLPKIEVFRTAAHRTPLYDPDDDASHDYVAIVADTAIADATVPVIRLDEPSWLDTLADLVERRIMNRATS